MADERTELEQKTAQEHAERIYKEYLALAEKVSKEPIIITGDYKIPVERIMNAVKVSFVAGFVLSAITFLGIILSPQDYPTSAILLTLTVLLFLPPAMIVPLELYSSRATWYEKENQKVMSERISGIEREKQGFTEFWYVWVKQRKDEKAEKSRQVLMGVLTVVGVIAAGAIASGLSESEYDRTRRAVRDEINSR